MHKSDIDYIILRILKDNPKITLIDKGLVKLSNFKRSDNKIGYLYALTPEGITAKSMLAQKFLKRKSEEYNKLKEEIEILKNEL